MRKVQLTKSILSVSLILAFSAVVACSPGGSGTNSDRHDKSADQAASSLGVKFSNGKVNDVYQTYLRLKDALVRADAKEAQKGAEALKVALGKAGSTRGAAIALKIAGANAIKEQRLHLDTLTFEVEKLLKSGAISSGKIYKQHCPMANNGKGGYWLAAEPTVKNPYYGDEMLNCGSVEEEIGPGTSKGK